MDFSDIRAYPPNEFAGLVILRPNRQDKEQVLNMVFALVPLLGGKK